MKITKLNFKYLYPQITSTLAECNYISLDFEFSGTSLRKDLVNTRFDDPNLRYFKLKENIKNFIPLQVGLTGLKLTNDESNQNSKINLYPMNFYIFPYVNGNLDKKLLFDIGSINFLTSNSFDFNKTFYDGIRFISLYEYEKTKKDKKLKEIIKSKREDKFYPPEARLFTINLYTTLKNLVENFINKNMDYNSPDNYLEIEITFVRKILIDYFLSNLNNLFKIKNNSNEINNTNNDNIIKEENIIFEVEIEDKNLLKSIMKIKITNKKLLEEKMVKLSVEKDLKRIASWIYYQSLIMNESDDEGNAEIWNKLLKKLYLNCDSKNNKNDIINSNLNNSNNPELIKILSKSIQSFDKIDDYNKIGFTKIIVDLIKLKKPIIFHNGILDLMHLIDKFIEPIPETFDEFKKIVNKHFPQIYDTKYLIENNSSLFSQFKDSSLESVSKKILSENLLKLPNLNIQIGEDYDWYKNEYRLDTPEIDENKNLSENINCLMSTRSHEAGYDSLMTMYSFIYIFQNLFKNISLMSNLQYAENCLRIFKNKLLFSNLQFPCDLNKIDKLEFTRRFEIFVMTDLPDIITPDEIKNNFMLQFEVKPQVYKLFGQNLAYIIFSSKEELEKVSNLFYDTNSIANLILQNYNKTCYILPYDKFLDNVRGNDSDENFEKIMKELEI